MTVPEAMDAAEQLLNDLEHRTEPLTDRERRALKSLGETIDQLIAKIDVADEE